MNSTPVSLYDVIIIGGSYAGLSAALALGRSLRNTLVIDGGLPCNRFSPHSHNMLTHDGATPDHIISAARTELTRYKTISLLSANAIDASQEEGNFVITNSDGTVSTSRKLIFASGIRDIMPAIPGFAECWGKTIIHCPYCHGYEVHSTALGVMANGDVAYEFGRMIRHWSANLTIFTNGPSTIETEKRTQLESLGIHFNEKNISAFIHANGDLKDIRLEDGSSVPLNAIFARLPFTQHSDLPMKLGCEIDDAGFIRVNEMNATSVPGIYAAGDNCRGMRAVSNAIAAGGRAGAMINRELIMAGF